MMGLDRREDCKLGNRSFFGLINNFFFFLVLVPGRVTEYTH